MEGQDGHDGVSDLLRAKALDEEVSEIYRRNNTFKNEMELDEFEGLLRRARGILSLVRNFGFEDPWGIDSLIIQAETLLNDAEYSSKLFESISRVGRKQQIDDLKIQYLLCSQDFTKAGTVAMRMLVEDEYIIDTIATNATNAVEQYFKTKKVRISLNPTQYLKRETRKAQVNVLQEAKNIFFCLDYSGSMAGERMKRANKNLLWVYKGLYGKWCLVDHVLCRATISFSAIPQSDFPQSTARIKTKSASFVSTTILTRAFGFHWARKEIGKSSKRPCCDKPQMLKEELVSMLP